MRVSGRLVERVVEADHALEQGQRLVEPPRVRRTDDRVAGNRDERLELTLTRGRDLLREARDRDLSEHLGSTAYAARPATEGVAVGPHGVGERGERPGDGLAEHRAARAVEVAREDRDHVDQPRRDGAELLVAEPDPAVDRGTRRGSEVVGDLTDLRSGHAARVGDRFGGERAGRGLDLVDPGDQVGDVAEVDEPVGEQHVDDREQHRCVGARDDRDPLVGPVRGPGAARVDDHRSPAPLPDLVDLPEHVGAREQAALRRLGVRTEHEEVVGALEVGCGDVPHPPVHERARDVLRPLVDRAGRVDHREAREPDQQADVPAEREVVDGRVADVGGHRLDAVPLADAEQELLAPGERVVPRDLAPLVALADHRLADAVGVLVEVAEGRALGAQEALAPDVVAVGTDEGHALVLDVELEAAHGLAERAGPVVEVRHARERTLPRCFATSCTPRSRVAPGERDGSIRAGRSARGPRPHRRGARWRRPARAAPAGVSGRGRHRRRAPPPGRGADRLGQEPGVPRADRRGRCARGGCDRDLDAPGPALAQRPPVVARALGTAGVERAAERAFELPLPRAAARVRHRRVVRRAPRPDLHRGPRRAARVRGRE